MSNQRIRAYVWEVPVRLTHWLNALSIVALSITGYYIGNPFIHPVSGDYYTMGWMRFVHDVAGYVLLVSVLLRIYWSFAGNKYSNWKVFFPFSNKKMVQIVKSLKYYLLINRKSSYLLGHSAIAGLTYLIFYLLFVFEIVSGFALYSVGHKGFILTLLGGWLTGLMSLQSIRLYHHLAMWAILTLTMAHVYVAWLVDSSERNGLMGSIFGGYKFITKDYET